MPDTLETIGVLQSQTLSASGTYDVQFASLGTLTVTGQLVHVDIDALSINALDTITVTGGAEVTMAPGLAVSLADTFNIGATGELDLASGFSIGALAAINFTKGGTLNDETGTSLDIASPLDNLGNGDKLSFGTTTVTSTSITTALGVSSLNVFDGATQIAKLTLGAGSDTNPADYANFVTNAQGGSSIAVACFAEGTRIRTSRGDVAIESLENGDVVHGPDGERLPIVWIGHRRVDCTRHPRPWDVWPIRVRAHAFGPNSPARDLLLSPDHAVYAEDFGVLVPVRYLVNGATVAQEAAARITYWHVELQRHALLLAEGLPCESYLDTGNRSAFASNLGVTALHADFARDATSLEIWETQSCAPLVWSGEMLADARKQLMDRLPLFGYSTTGDPSLRAFAGEQKLDLSFDGIRYFACIPEDATELRLVSRSCEPALLYPESSDTRRLGIPVAAIVCDGVNVELNDARLGRGWHDSETELRWTDGAAVIDVRNVVVLELYLADMMPQYRVQPDNETVQLRSMLRK